MKSLRTYMLLCVLSAFLCAHNAHGQDIHFSQFYQSPLNINPALCGQFNGAYRLTGIYRSQWASVTVPYTTIALSGEAKNIFKIPKLHAGIDLLYDKAGDGNMGTFAINFTGSYTILSWDNARKKITGGIQIGWAQRQIDPSKLYFSSQLNQGQSFETFADNYSYANSKMGITYQQKFKGRNELTVGYNFDNLLHFSANFYEDNTDNADFKHGIYVRTSWMISDDWDILPTALILFQGAHQQFTPGAQVRYILQHQQRAYRALYAGLFTRAGDAAFLTLGMDWNTLNVGLAYDFNYSQLSRSSNGRGAFEISFVYLFQTPLPPRKRFKSCPNFI